MPQKVRIALDAMGGDIGASVVIPGAAISLSQASRHRIPAVRRPRADRRRARQASGDEGRLARHPYRRRRQHARQAEPGAAPRPQDLVDVAGDRRRQEGRGRRRDIRRQHRRTDGDGAVLPAHDGRHRPPGAGGDLADRAWRFGDSRCRRHHRRRCPASQDAGPDGRRDGQRAVRSGTADGGAAQYRHRGNEGPRRNPRGRRIAARGGFAATGLHRLRRRRRHRQGRRRRHRHRRLQRQYLHQGRRRHGAADHRISAFGDVADLALQDRLSVRQERLQGAEGQARSQQIQRRRFPRAQGHRREKPRRRHTRRLCLRDRCWL